MGSDLRALLRTGRDAMAIGFAVPATQARAEVVEEPRAATA